MIEIAIESSMLALMGRDVDAGRRLRPARRGSGKDRSVARTLERGEGFPPLSKQP